MDTNLLTISALILGYLLGSIPFGLIVGRYFGLGDIRQSGSGNIGATNMTRVAGKKFGAIVLVLDAAKGLLAVWIVTSNLAPNQPSLAIWTGFAAILGHIFPIWLKFQGGKGVATALAVHTILMWPLGLSVIATWLLTFLLSKVSGLSAVIAMMSAPLWSHIWSGDPYLTLYTILVSIIVIYRHKNNIQQMLIKNS